MLALGGLAIVLVGLWYFGQRATWAIWSGLDGHRSMRPFAWIVLAPGVATHEAAHALAALACGAGVREFVPFRPTRTPDGWQFGYVQPGPSSATAAGIIALAPLWLTPLLVYGVGTVLTGASGVHVWGALAWGSVWTWLWLWWLVSVSLANMPSRPDFVIARPLLLAMAVVAVCTVALHATGRLDVQLEPIALAVLAMLAPQCFIVAVLAAFARR